jgi:3-oxoadipate enol-lactonase
VTPPADGRFLAEHIPGAAFVQLDAAHLANLEAAGQFTAAVADFLTERS